MLGKYLPLQYVSSKLYVNLLDFEQVYNNP